MGRNGQIVRISGYAERRQQITGCVHAAQTMTTAKSLIVVAVVATLAACAPLAQVQHVNPSLGTPHGILPDLQRAERAIADAENTKHTDPKTGIGLYLSGVESATRELRKNPTDHIALRDYNFALSRVFSVIRDAHLDPCHTVAARHKEGQSLIHFHSCPTRYKHHRHEYRYANREQCSSHHFIQLQRSGNRIMEGAAQ